MAAESVRKKKKGLFWRIAAVCVLAYVGVSFVQLQVDLGRKRTELASLEQQVEDQLLENQELQALLDMRQDEEYIERVARDRLDYAYPDEKVYIDISGN